jgi:hypothetical protein
MLRSRKLPLVLGATIAVIMPVLSVATSAPASAEKIGGDKFHDEFGFIEKDFCGVPGLTVEHDVTVDGRFLERLQGRDSIFYGMDNTRVVDELTNVVTGQHATDIQPRTTSKDLKITVNDDGTITIIQLLTGGGRLLGDDGHLIAKGSGQVRFELVVDYMGTLSDPDDDVQVAEPELIFGSTGTNDDYCVAILEDWGIS